MRIKGLLLFVAYFFPGSAKLFSQQFPFVYYTPKDGLVNSRVRSIKQDSKGQMYFLTYGGLSVYDGSRFTNFGQLDGLANELVNDLVEITPDSILVATNATQLNTLVRGKVGIYKTVDNFCPVINRFIKSRDGHWYVAADEGFFELNDHKFTRLPVINDQGIIIGNLDRVIEWNNFFLIIPWNSDQKEKLILYDKQNRRVTDILTQEQVICTAADSKGHLWASTSEGIKLIDLVSLEKGKINLLPLPAEYNYLDRWKYSRIFFDATGNTWLSSNNQIITITLQGQQQIISGEQGLKTSSLVDIFIDREGIIWMASDGNGVVKMTGTQVQLLNNFLLGKASFITAINQQRDTTWLFNYADKSIYSISKKGLQSFPFEIKNIKVSTLYIQNQALYLTDVKNVFRITNKDLASSYKHPVKILTYPVLDIGNGIVDINGVLIQSIRRDDTGFYLTALYEDKVNMSYRLSYAADQVAMDKKGRLWAVTRDDHLMVFTLHPEQPSRYLQLLKDYTSEIAGMNPRSVTIDKTGNAWIGTRYKGLYYIRFNDLQFISSKQFTTHEGLTDNFIYRLYCDDHDNIWTGTQTGLDKIFFKNGQYIIENVTKSKNIFQTIYKIITVDNNTIWALTSDGNIIKVSTAPSARLYPSPSLLLTSLIVNDQAYDDSTHSFAHNQNNFSISVAAPSFLDERSIRYSYLLKGSGKNNWSEPSNNATFNFINLTPGKYELNLKADFPSAMYPTQTQTYSFTIHPPYWQTWWFRILAAVVVISLIYYMVSTYYRRIFERKHMQFEKQQALEKERTRIATDMHDDLGAGLSKIRFLSETVQRNISEEVHQPNLQNIASSSVELVDKFNEIIWAMNEKNNSLEDLLYYIRNYSAKYCAENNLDYKIFIPEDIPSIMISGEMRRQIFLTVKESLHNVVKHAEARNVRLRVQIGAVITIIIQDDGKGFEIDEMKNKGNGLRNMEQRIKNVNGKLIIENKTGTLLNITVPLPAD